MHHRQFTVFLIIFISTGLPYGIAIADHTSNLKGVVIDYTTNQPLPGVQVYIEKNGIYQHTDVSGQFLFQNLPSGKYTLVCLKENYYSTISESIELASKATAEVKLTMLPGEPEKYLYMNIGGITVIADRELIPETHKTVHKISAGEIEHLQATNLGDLLDLIPGVERQNRPGLNSQNIVGLRGAGTEGQLDYPELFGTKILVDDIPLSNNANLNHGTGIGYGSTVRSSALRGIDLRTIAADNIQNVEVITGVPSVEYGDLTTGIVRVNTRSAVQPPRLKFKTNPDTRELNLTGGTRVYTNTSVNYNINYAYSKKDLRQDGDEASRISGQLKFRTRLSGRGLDINNRFYYTRFFEDYFLPDDPTAPRAYNRDFKLTYGTKIKKTFKKQTSIDFTGFITYYRRKSYKSEFEVVDPTYLSNSRQSGTVEATLLSDPYTWQVNTLGKEYSLGLKLKLNKKIVRKTAVHNLLAGIEYNFDVNKGSGKQYDPLRPPYGQTGNRPRAFDDIPGINQMSIFFEERFTCRAIVPVTLTLGLRGEMYNPENFGGSKLIKSQNGTFWNPRTGLQIKLVKGLQIRASYGKSTKAPPLLLLYPEPVYLDLLEWGRTSGQDSIPLITTYVFPLNNRNLQAYQQKKFELGLDFQFKNIGLSFSGYQQKSFDLIESQDLPYTIRRYAWPNWPSSDGKILKSETQTLLSGYARRQNTGSNIRKGVEFSLKTHRFPILNTMFRVTGSYNFYRYMPGNTLDLDTPRQFSEISAAGDTVTHFAYMMFPQLSKWTKKLIMNYNIDYINKTLGIWVTFTMYHKIYQKEKDADLPSIYYYSKGYYEKGQYIFLDEEKSRKLGLKNTVSEGKITVYRKPANFYFNLTISKMIYQGMEVSLFLNNFLNERSNYVDQYGQAKIANPEIFYGMELSMQVGPVANLLKRRITGFCQ